MVINIPAHCFQAKARKWMYLHKGVGRSVSWYARKYDKSIAQASLILKSMPDIQRVRIGVTVIYFVPKKAI